MELLADWGTTNSTVGELVDILKSHKLLAAANVLLPGMIIYKWHYSYHRLYHRPVTLYTVNGNQILDFIN